jgi:hypothetical protein
VGQRCWRHGARSGGGARLDSAAARARKGYGREREHGRVEEDDGARGSDRNLLVVCLFFLHADGRVSLAQAGGSDASDPPEAMKHFPFYKALHSEMSLDYS